MKYVYLIPLIAAFVCVIHWILLPDTRYRLQSFQQRNKDRISDGIRWIIAKLVPKNGKIYGFYEASILQYSKLSVEKLVSIKMTLFVMTLCVIVLVKLTNIHINTEEIFGKFDYRADLIYEYNSRIIDVSQALQQEITYFEMALKVISKPMIYGEAAEEIQHKIKNLIHEEDEVLLQPKDTIANKIYHRIVRYHSIREWDISLYIMIALLFSFMPELYLSIRKIFIKADARRELIFLKRLLILNGSIKPVDFMEVLKILIDKSKYYKKILQEIEDKNKKNSVDNCRIYNTYIRNWKDVDLKLFFEKLDEANNYDFDQAILNIENEFRLQRREEIRKVRKRIEFIHVMGIMGFMLIITLLIVYLIIPWMQLYDMNKILM
ncbi:MAG: hypothetical protein MJB12_14805 [Firmicutes bacterium]|nr:hypothetical protein [Bacillota bacterium]